jgi:PAS domain S-box-containing protein
VRPRLRVRSYLVILVLAALLPVVTFATIVVARLATYERATSEQGMRETARALSLAVDRELASARATLLLLVTSPHLRSGDLEAFRRQCADALSLSGTWIMLAEPSGRQLVNTLRSPDGAAPEPGEVDVLRRVAATGRPVVSDLIAGSISGASVTVNVPVFEGRRVRYVLSMAVLPEGLNSILLEQKLAPNVIGAVYDRRGVAIARTLGMATFIGRPAPARLAEAMAATGEGWIRDSAVDGPPAYFAFSRSKLSGWTVALAEPVGSFDATFWRSLGVMGVAGILAVLLAIGMAAVVGTRISGSIVALASAAPAVLTEDQHFPVPSSPLREIGELAAALEGARETMHRQARERRRLLAEAEEAVRRRAESLALVDTLIANAPVGMAVVDRDLRFTHVNGALAAMNGLTVAEHIGRSLRGVVPDLAPTLEPIFQRILDTGEPILDVDLTGETALAPGDRRDWLGSYYPIPGPDGKPAGIGTVLREITERKRTERAIVTTNQTLQALIHSSPLAIAILDGRLRVQLWSPAAERMLGWTADEVIGRPYPALRETDREEFARTLRAQLEGEVGPGVETQRLRKDGSTVEVSVWIAPLGADDEPDAVVVIHADITARKRAQEALRRRGEQLQVLSRAAHRVNSVLEMTTVMRTLVNSAMELVEASGGMAGLVLDGHLVFSEHHDGQRVRPLELVTPSGHGVAGHVVRTARPYVANDAASDPMVAREIQRTLGFRTLVTVPIFRRDGRVLGCFEVYDKRDGRPFEDDDVVLLEGLAASAAIALENARLLVEREEADRAKDQFLATLSHELRTPLTAILGWTRMLRSGRLDAATQVTALATIERNTRLQTQLIEDLLDVSRIISGKLRLDRQPVELAAVIETAAQSLRSVAEGKGVALDIALSSGGGIVDGDPHRLQQVVLNLLSNAIKFTPAGGRVDVSLEGVGDRIRVVVRDTGQGIAAEVLPHVFDRFRQADSTHTKQHGGLGLGLAIVRHLVALHGGTARAESAGPGRGATFTIELPLAASVERGETPQLAAPRADDGRSTFACPPVLEGLRIMVVDDEPDARWFVARVLQECKAQVTAVGSASEALAVVSRLRPHVLVSDIGMPRIDGYELLRTIRDRRPEDGGQIPALALTAYASAEDRERAMAVGYQRHLAKPVDPSDLVDVVAELADRAAVIDGVRTIGD